jgi:hypothetical protein
MPKAILLKTYDNNLRKGTNHVAYFQHYDLGNGIKVTLKKERESFTKDAGWGLQALTPIPDGFALGHFVVKRHADEPEEGAYSIKTRSGKFLVLHPNSLLNKINTIVNKKFRHKCNCVFGNVTKKDRVSIKTSRNIKTNEMLWVKYNDKSHYWNVQYSILEKRLKKVQSNDANDSKCGRCSKRHVLLVLCDSCPVAICVACLKSKEKFIIERKRFFCSQCLDAPPKYMNRFKRKTT